MPLASFVPGWRYAGAVLSCAHQLIECFLSASHSRLQNCRAILERRPLTRMQTRSSTHIAALDWTLWSSKHSHTYLLHQALMIRWRLASELTDSCRAETQMRKKKKKKRSEPLRLHGVYGWHYIIMLWNILVSKKRRTNMCHISLTSSWILSLKKSKPHKWTWLATCLSLPEVSAQWWKGEVTAVQRISAGLLCLCAATSCLTVSVLVVRRRGHHTGLRILREEQTMETQALLQPSVSFQMLASKDSATNPMLTSAMCVGSGE